MDREIHGRDLMGAVAFGRAVLGEDMAPIYPMNIRSKDGKVLGRMIRVSGGPVMGVAFRDETDAIYTGDLIRLKIPLDVTYNVPESRHYAMYETPDRAYVAVKTMLPPENTFKGEENLYMELERRMQPCRSTLVSAPLFRRALADIVRVKAGKVKMTVQAGACHIVAYRDAIPVYSQRLGESRGDSAECTVDPKLLLRFVKLVPQGLISVKLCDGVADLMWESGSNRYNVFIRGE